MLDASAILGRLADEFTARVRAGEVPAVEDYALRHPDLAGRIRELFPTLLMLEGLAAGRGERATGSDHVGRSFGPYRVVREIGRGGMGVVYEAVHEPLHKRVALKLLTVTSPGAAGQLERFFREAQTAAGLHHTNIVPVFDIGQVGGTPYYAMQYIEGRGLDHVLRDESRAASEGAVTVDLPAEAPTLPPGAEPLVAPPTASNPLLALRAPNPTHFRWVAEVGIQAADGLAYAHERGVIHRDIKPSNLIQDDRGVVWIADFGLARRADDPGLTKSGALVGTPRYMSPEQAAAAKKPIDHRTDVYSLGATLYELLTRRPAFDGPTPLDVVMQILERTPVSPRKLDPAVPRDLETIVLKAMAKRPEDRYPSAGALGADLKAWRDDRPIAARLIGPLGRFVRWSRRNPLVAGLTAAVFALLLVTAIGSVIAALAIRDQRNQAQSYLDTMLVGTSLLHLEQAKASLASTADGRRWNALNHLRLADHYAKPYRASRPDEVPSVLDMRSTAVAALMAHDLATAGTWSYGDLTFPPAFSRGGRYAIAFRFPKEYRDRRADESVIDLIDLSAQKLLLTQPAPQFLIDELNKNDTKMVFKNNTATNKWAINPDGKLVVWAPYKGRILLWRIGEAEPTAELIWPSRAKGKLHLRQLAFSPGGDHIVALASDDMTVAEAALWTVGGKYDGRLLTHFEPDRLGTMAFSGDGHMLVVPSQFDAVKIWDIRTNAAGREIVLPANQPRESILNSTLSLNSDGSELAVRLLEPSGERDVIQLWNLETRRVSRVFEFERDHYASALAFEPNGHRLVVAERSNELLQLFDTRTGERLTQLPSGAFLPIEQLEWTEGGLLAASSQDQLKVWSVSQVDCVEKLSGDAPTAEATVEVSPNGRLCAVISHEDKPIEILELATGRMLGRLTVPKTPESRTFGTGAFSADYERFTLFLGTRAFTWNLNHRAPFLPETRDLGHQLNDPVQTDDGRILGWFEENDSCVIWDGSVRRAILTVPHHARSAITFHTEAFLSRDGNWFTIVPTDDLENSTDTTIAVWHVPTQSKRFEWPRYRSNREQLTTSQVSPNGDWLVQTTIDPANTRDQNRAGVIINLRTGRRHELPASAWTALVSAFSRDESLIAIAFEDRSVELFRVSTGELLLRLPASNQKIRDLWFAPNGTDLVLLGEHHVTVQILKVNAIRRQLADLGLDW